MRCYQTAGSLTLRHLSLEEPLQDPGQHSPILQVSSRVQGFLSPSNLKPQLLFQTTERSVCCVFYKILLFPWLIVPRY